jgi:hypothetical protein
MTAATAILIFIFLTRPVIALTVMLAPKYLGALRCTGLAYLLSGAPLESERFRT